MLPGGWDTGPCHSPPGNAGPGRRAPRPLGLFPLPAAAAVRTGPRPRHSCPHHSQAHRNRESLYPAGPQPGWRNSWDLGDAGLGVWRGEPPLRSSDAPCTGSQAEFPEPGVPQGWAGPGPGRLSPRVCCSWRRHARQGPEAMDPRTHGTPGRAALRLPLWRAGAQPGPRARPRVGAAGPGDRLGAAGRTLTEQKGKLRLGG